MRRTERTVPLQTTIQINNTAHFPIPCLFGLLLLDRARRPIPQAPSQFGHQRH